MNATQSKLHVHIQLASKKPVYDNTKHDYPEKLLDSIGSTQTLPKLHLATL